MRKILFFVLCIGAFAGTATGEDELMAKAEALAHRIIIIDTHIDVPYRLWNKREDISGSTESGDFDYVRARKGGLDAPFFSIYVPASYEKTGGAKALADSLIDMVDSLVSASPGKFALASSIRQVKDNFKKGRMSILMGIENGSAIEGDLGNIGHFYERGVRYITLTHAEDNRICDSSYDTTRTWKGLSPFGRKVVAEMNRVGMMIDVSHVSDDAFYQVIALSKAPVIASHSCCRHFTPGFERNMDDDMIRKLAGKGGVIQINFGSTFLRGDLNAKMDESRKAIEKLLAAKGLKWHDREAREYVKRYRKEHPIGFASVKDVADHIDHVVSLVGVEHVGLGSDFEGVGDTLPVGLKDVSGYPNLIYELLRRGYSEEDIAAICSGNLLRVWSQVEKAARDLAAGE
jgi:membrane dipeptidase